MNLLTPPATCPSAAAHADSCVHCAASPLRRYGWYRRLHARALAQGNRRYEAAIAPAKRALLGSLAGTVLEIGPGTGSSLGFFGPGVRWIGAEPNAAMHPFLQAAARRCGRPIELLEAGAEALPLADASVDHVVCSLVLCSVVDPAAVLAEVRRVLRPGGRFVFIEHVAAEPGTWLRRMQRALRGVQAVVGDGCAPDRETLSFIESAGFEWVVSSREPMPVPLVGPHLIGFALR